MAATLADLKSAIGKSEKVVIGDLTIRQLAAINPPYGVYLFFATNDQTELLYVGKVASQSFVVRLAAHFDPRHDSWLNQFVTYCTKYQKCAYSDALNFALSQRVVVITCDAWADREQRKRGIRALETALRRSMRPTFNPAPLNGLSDQTLVADICSHAP